MTTAFDLKRVLLESLVRALEAPVRDDYRINDLCSRLDQISGGLY